MGEIINPVFYTGIRNTETKTLHSIFPNFVDDSFKVISNSDPIRAEIFSLTGLKLKTNELTGNYTIYVSELNSGCYLVKVTNKDKTNEVFKFTKK
jgi:hypothetical protein